MSRLFTAGLIAVSLLVVAPAAGAQSTDRCSERFADSTFETSASAGVVSVHGSGLSLEMTERFADDFRPVAEWMQEDMGGLEGTAVCIFADELPLDAVALGWPVGQSLRSIAFGEDKLVAVSSWLIGTVPDSGRHGIMHVAFWSTYGGPYPEPLATDAMAYYRNRVTDTVDSLHRLMVRQNIGLAEPWPPIPWTAGLQADDPLLWNPEFPYDGAGDFTAYAVATAGTQILSDPVGAGYESLDAGWRQSLFDESGSVLGGRREWVVGLWLVIGAVLLAVFMAWFTRFSRRRAERLVRESAIAEMEGISSVPEPVKEPEAVRVSVPGRRGRRDPRVGRRSSSRSGRSNDRDRPPSGGKRGADVDDVPSRRESRDDPFLHPGFDGDE